MATVPDDGRGSVTSSRGVAASTTSRGMNIRGSAAPRGSYKTDGTYGRGGAGSGNYRGRTEYSSGQNQRGGTFRGGQRGGNSGRYQNWWCNCGYENFEYKRNCGRCNESKPAQGPVVGVENRSPYHTLQVTGALPNRPKLYQPITEPVVIEDDGDWDDPAPAQASVTGKGLDVVDAGANQNASIKDEGSKSAKVSKGPGREWNCPDPSCDNLNGIDKWHCTKCNLSAPPWPEDK